LTIFDCKFGAI